MNTKAGLNTVLAIGRRVLIAAGSGMLAVLLTQWSTWLEQGVKADPDTAVWWPVIWAMIEAFQKFLRERKKLANGK